MQSQQQPSGQLVRLKCAVQNYDWGKIGASSAVAVLGSQSTDPPTEIKPLPYAELWMGTHEKGPSYVLLPNGETKLAKEFLGADLPFLFKVLSVAKALSIQAHPDMKLAQQLHRERPKIYADPFHKPEMAIAVTDFEVMCGFRTATQIAANLERYSHFRAVVGEQTAQRFIQAARSKDTSAEEAKSALVQLFTNIMKADTSVLASQIPPFITAVESQSFESKLDDSELKPRDLPAAAIISRLHKQYPGDVGVFAPLFLNCFRLGPGEAIFLGPNEPHAYLDGDCIECMACSDNVVRAGLTPKLRDVDTLCNMLTYRTMYPNILKGDAVDQYSARYDAPVPEFATIRTQLPADATYQLSELASPSIVLVYSGNGQLSSGAENSLAVRAGSILLLTANAVVQARAGPEGLLLYRCSSNTHMPAPPASAL